VDEVKLSQAALRISAVAIMVLLGCSAAFAGLPIPAPGVPELDPGTESGGIALAAVAAILLVERYRNR
jgi:hypothetical protein